MTPLRWLLFSFALAASGNTQAADKICDEKDPDKCSQPVAKGQVAPFDGQLITTKLAVALGQKADRCDAVTAIEVDRVRGLLKVDLDLEHSLRLSESDGAKQREDLLMRKIDEAAPRWYERPVFVATVTGVVVVAAYVLAMKSVDWVKIR